jgi:sugar phosphate isomerase/epimerase
MRPGISATVTPPSDRGKLVGMSIALPRLGFEDACIALQELGLEAIEVFLGQIGPGVMALPVNEAHARAVAETAHGHGLVVSTLNVVGDVTFDPFTNSRAANSTTDALASHLRLGEAMGSPRVLIWEGRVADRAAVPAAISTLIQIIERARDLSHLPEPPEISVELHPYTFAFEHDAVLELGTALAQIGAGLCLDFCHFGVALGRDFHLRLTEELMATVNHVHFADSDCRTPDFHFPPGDGILDFTAIGERLRSRDVTISWDLFSWLAPRDAMKRTFGRYQAFVAEFGPYGRT